MATINGTNGDDVLTGTADPDSIDGKGGNDTLSGLGGNDDINGGNGNDILDGGTGADLMNGGPGDDTYYVDDLGDVVVDTSEVGTDIVYSSVTFTLPTNVENLVLTGTGDINGTGNNKVNVIVGNDGNNVIDAGGGDDTVYGGAGADVIDGGTGADYMDGGAGDDVYYVDNPGDVVVEGPDNGYDIVYSWVDITVPDNVEEVILLGDANLNITGTPNDDILTGNAGNNVINALPGNDKLTGNAGNDTLHGGPGADTANYLTSPAAVTVNLTTGTASDGWGGTDTLTGIENIIGSNFDDTLIGDAENNVIDGRGGVDGMSGLAGDDVYFVDNTADTIIEAAGQGTDQVFSSATYTLSANVENLWLTGAANIDGTGNALDNIINGNSGNNVLTGNDGNDTISGYEGNDTIYGGLGNDKLAGNDGNDLVYGGDGDDRIGGHAGDDLLDGGAGTDIADYTYATMPAGVTVNLATGTATDGWGGTDTLVGIEDVYGSAHDDTLIGNAAVNTLLGFAGDDVLDGGAGADFLYGGLGNDTYYVDDVSDLTSDAGGTDLIISTTSLSLDYRTTIENLTLAGSAVNGFGNDSNNVITGNDLNNDLRGGAGNDTLFGGLGADLLTGGSGADTLVYTALDQSGLTAATRDALYGFSEAEGDVIDVSAIDADATQDGDQAFTLIGTAPFTAAGQIRYVVGPTNMVVYFNTDDDADAEMSIRLSGVTSLTSAAFNL